jgi:hypothetical protein
MSQGRCCYGACPGSSIKEKCICHGKKLEDITNYQDQKQPIEIIAKIIQMFESADKDFKVLVIHIFKYVKEI